MYTNVIWLGNIRILLKRIFASVENHTNYFQICAVDFFLLLKLKHVKSINALKCYIFIYLFMTLNFFKASLKL